MKITMREHDLSKKWKIGDYCALYIVMWSVIPFLSRGDIYRYLAVGASFVVLINILNSISENVSKYMFFSTLLLLIFLMNYGLFIGDVSGAISRCVNLFVFCMLGLISIYYYENDRKKFSGIAGMILFLYVLVAIPSIIALQSNRWILRNASGRTPRNGIEVFAGSYGYAFGCLFLVVFLIYSLRTNKRNKIVSLVGIGLITLFGYIVLNAGYTTALVLLVIGVFSAFFIPKKNSIGSLFILFIAAALLMMIVPIFLNWVVANFEISDVYRAKIKYLAQLTSSSSDVTYEDSTRGGMFYESLDALIHNPILGSAMLRGQEASTGHAVILDTLVNHGIVYFLLYLYVIILTPWRMLKEDKALQMIYLTMIVLLGLTDTIDYATMAVPLFIGPMIVHNALINNSERKDL